MSITNEIAGSLSKLTRGVEQIRSEQITRGDKVMATRNDSRATAWPPPVPTSAWAWRCWC